jgi:glutamyl-tRNA synthetase
MQKLPPKQRIARVVAFLQRSGLVADPPSCDTAPYVARIVEAAGDRLKVAGDILDYEDFFVADDHLRYDADAFEMRIRKPARAREFLQQFRAALAVAEPFTAENLEQALHAFVESRGIKAGEIVHAVRVSITGKSVGFGLFDTLAILGRERVLARIDRALELSRP